MRTFAFECAAIAYSSAPPYAGWTWPTGTRGGSGWRERRRFLSSITFAWHIRTVHIAYVAVVRPGGREVWSVSVTICALLINFYFNDAHKQEQRLLAGKLTFAKVVDAHPRESHLISRRADDDDDYVGEQCASTRPTFADMCAVGGELPRGALFALRNLLCRPRRRTLFGPLDTFELMRSSRKANVRSFYTRSAFILRRIYSGSRK